MARNAFGASSADFEQDDRGNRRAGRTGTVWTAQTGGTQITDLLNTAGDPITELTSSSHPIGLVQFQGPADGRAIVWVDFGGAGRVKVVGDAPLVQVVQHGAVASTARPVGAAMVIWYGSVQPTFVTAPDLVVRTDEAV